MKSLTKVCSGAGCLSEDKRQMEWWKRGLRDSGIEGLGNLGIEGFRDFGSING